MAWDSTMRIVEKKSEKDIAHIVYSRFKSGDTKDGTKYSIGGLYVRPIVTRVTKNALQLIRKNNKEAIVRGKGIDYKKLKVRAAGITREHIIPVESLYKHFVGMGGRLSERYILEIMPMLEIALITKKENELLKSAGLNSKMPEGWWECGPHDPLARYRQSGLGDSVWARKFN